MSKHPSEETKEKGYSNFLSFLFSLLFLGLYATGVYFTEKHNALQIIKNLTTTEIVILTLASFRLTRLFVYDSIMQWKRDFFLDKKESYDKKTDTYHITRTKPKSGIRRLFADLLSCPWCTGVWVSLIVFYAYIFFPAYSFPLFIILSIAGLSSTIQICINGTGWWAEKGKQHCQSFPQKK